MTRQKLNADNGLGSEFYLFRHNTPHKTKRPGVATGPKGTLNGEFVGTEETTFQGDHGHRPWNTSDEEPGRKFNPATKKTSVWRQAQAARLVLVAACVALTAVLVMAWKLASATSAACLAAFWTVS